MGRGGRRTCFTGGCQGVPVARWCFTHEICYAGVHANRLGGKHAGSEALLNHYLSIGEGGIGLRERDVSALMTIAIKEAVELECPARRRGLGNHNVEPAALFEGERGALVGDIHDIWWGCGAGTANQKRRSRGE